MQRADSYGEAIAGLEKLIIRFELIKLSNIWCLLDKSWIDYNRICSEKGELAPMAVAEVDKVTAGLETENGSAVLSPSVERLKTGFLTFKKKKYK